ncbi:uncharacterized protein LOC116001384 [Ipomoea triloba]|uniref:uncharacterized protein LOC116001384 n=1 Tax=Ipomoea triloba TaxID=35885 RepID=UPI00125DBAF6|nr:uncharacterized protein LOC116001384 [Ipomoea triloba]
MNKNRHNPSSNTHSLCGSAALTQRLSLTRKLSGVFSSPPSASPALQHRHLRLSALGFSGSLPSAFKTLCSHRVSQPRSLSGSGSPPSASPAPVLRLPAQMAFMFEAPLSAYRGLLVLNFIFAWRMSGV